MIDKKSDLSIKKIAVVGSQGVPAAYGGFESLVENLLGDNCSNNIEYTVFCSSKDLNTRLHTYKGAILKYVPLRANGIQSVIYDAWSLARCILSKEYDCVLMLGVSGCWFLPFIRSIFRGKIVVNIDGLEHRRAKWKPWIKRFLRYSESMAIRYADTIVSDNKGIQDYVTQTYGRESTLIAYGADHALRSVDNLSSDRILHDYSVESGKYAIAVCRIEPENNSMMVLDAFTKMNYPLLYIGNWIHSEYSRSLKEKYGAIPNIHLIDSVYDLDVLYVLRSNAGIYIHGHSAGGTNPSLVEAMILGKPILAYDVIYNRETTGNRASYFKTTDDIVKMIPTISNGMGDILKKIALNRYTWRIVARQYESLY